MVSAIIINRGRCLFSFLFLVSFSYAIDYAVVKGRAAFLFPQPDETTEIRKLILRGESLRLSGKMVDDLDRLWYRVVDQKGDTGWVESNDLSLTAKDQKKISGGSGKEKKKPKKTMSKTSQRERLAYIKKNPQIERRFKKLIKDGFIGMDMSEENVRASLGNPDAERVVVLLKRGKLPIWIYHPQNPVVVVFEEGKVTGWSQE